MQDWLDRCHFGDALATLQRMPDACVHTCVTSPPYYGLRDYGHPDQIGLEETPDAFVQRLVEVFREVRRVLRDDATLWVNMGDSYNASPGQRKTTDKAGEKQLSNEGSGTAPSRSVDGLKPKDLIGIPWMLATALRDPYYTGPVKNELDRVWLAAMLDAEGSICGTEYMTGDRTKTNIYISITNTSTPIIEKCIALFPQVARNVYEKKNGVSNRICYRWDVERMDEKAMFIRTIYPYLVAKRKQAILGYTFIEMQRGLVSKKKGYLPDQHEQRSWLMSALSALNSGQDIDLPDWAIEPPSLHEPGYYLRQDIIWSKPNPMPESVTDRCTKAHEYIFLLSKSARYYCDMDAIAEAAVADHAPGNHTHKGAATAYAEEEGEHHRTKSGLVAYAQRQRKARDGQDDSHSLHGGEPLFLRGQPAVLPAAAVAGRGGKNAFRGQGHFRDGANGPANRDGRDMQHVGAGDTRNKRSVWTVSTKPYSGAHFAVFPPDLIEPCILAGAPGGGVVLDPFFGSGTTGQVAQRLGRRFIGIELNPAYGELQAERLAQPSLELA